MIDTFCPIGPYIVPKDQVSDPRSLAMKFRLNGIETENSNTSEMGFDIPLLINIVSRYCNLEVGNIIASGEPGCPGPLTPGEIMEAEIEGIGVLRNPTKLY
jgi:2-keto-4-pentenoate hydratase/2-oxohepta-3-ene-1,7-dioic acid hydratase in catechol pathway